MQIVTSYFMTVLMLALSLTIYKIFVRDKFYIEIGGQVEEENKWDLRCSTWNVRFYVDNLIFFRYPVPYVYARGYTWTYTYTTRNKGADWRKIYNADFA